MTVLITGASSGLGLAIAKQMAKQKIHDVIITGREIDKLNMAVNLLNVLTNKNVRGIIYDQASKESIDDLIKNLSVENSCLDVVISTIGVNAVFLDGYHKVHKTSYEAIEEVILTNVVNAIYLLGQLLTSPQIRSSGKIAMIGSLAYQYGVRGQVAYNVSKSALLGLHNTLIAEYKDMQSFLFEVGVIDSARNAKHRSALLNNPLVNMLNEDDVAKCVVQEILTATNHVQRTIS